LFDGEEVTIGGLFPTAASWKTQFVAAQIRRAFRDLLFSGPYLDWIYIFAFNTTPLVATFFPNAK
jgi:hypothetical protein